MLAPLVGQSRLLDVFPCGISREGHLEACLAVEGDGKLHLVLHEVSLFPRRPCGIADTLRLAAQLLPQLFGHVRCERCDEDDHLLQQFTAGTLLLSEFVHADHESRDGRVVRELFDVAGHFLDEPVDALERLL